MLKEKLAKRMNTFPLSGIRKVQAEAKELESHGENIIHMEMGMPDFDTPEYIKKACIQSIKDGHVFYTVGAGLLDLRKAISKKLEKENHLTYSTDEIVVTIGLSAGIFTVYAALLDAEDEVLIPNPVYPPYLNIPHLLGAKTIDYSLLEINNYQPDITEIENKITKKTKAIVIISPNNPLGSILTHDSLQHIAKLAIQYNLAVITDEIYERILFDKAVHYSIASFPHMKERTLTLNGFSKTYSMTGWRLGYIAGPKEIMPDINKLHGHMNSCATTFVQDAAITALTEEHEEVEKMVTAYQQRKDYLVRNLNKIEGISCTNPQGAFYLFLNIKKLGMTSEEAASYFLHTAHVALVPGTVFGSNGAGYIRMSFANSMKEIKTACFRIQAAVEKLKK